MICGDDNEDLIVVSLITVEYAYCILEHLIERCTNVKTDVLKHINGTLCTACDIVAKLVVVVVVKNIGRVSRYVVKERSALYELLGVNADCAGTTYVVDLSKVLVTAVSTGVKRNGNNTESADLTHVLVLLVLKSTNHHDISEEN